MTMLFILKGGNTNATTTAIKRDTPRTKMEMYLNVTINQIWLTISLWRDYLSIFLLQRKGVKI